MKKLLIQISMVLLANFSYAQKQVLGFNLAVGDTYHHTVESKSIVRETVNGQEMRIEIGVSGKTSFKVLQKTDSVYKMDVSYQELSMTMNLPSGIVTYSSEKADEEPVSKLFRAFKGKQF